MVDLVPRGWGADKPRSYQAVEWWWWLIWCHERSCKQENDGLRKTIGDLAEEHRGSLVCLKKAEKFAFWVSNANRQRLPYVLLTDWREVKLCMQTIAQRGVPDLPAMVILLSDRPKQYEERILPWVKKLVAHGFTLLHVIQDVSELSGLILTMANQYSGNGTPWALQAATWPVSPLPLFLPDEGTEEWYEDSAACGMSFPPHVFASQPLPSMLVSGQKSGEDVAWSLAHPFIASKPPGLDPPVVEMMTRHWSPEDGVDVEDCQRELHMVDGQEGKAQLQCESLATRSG